MQMRKLVLVAATLAALLPATATAASTVEGETGSPVLAACATDGETMTVTSESWASGGQTLFFPHNGCQAVYGGPLGYTVTSITFANGGVGAASQVCGRFDFTGSVLGSTGSVCTPDDSDRIRTVSVSTTAGVGTTFVVTWVPTDGTPAYANAFLDKMVLE